MIRNLFSGLSRYEQITFAMLCLTMIAIAFWWRIGIIAITLLSSVSLYKTIVTKRHLSPSTSHPSPHTSHPPLLSNVRHYEALGRVDDALRHAADALADGTPADLVAVDLRDALYHLGTITGEVSSDEILSDIFSRFCIGK